MKLSSAILAALLLATSVAAAAPARIDTRGVLRDSGGAPITGDVNVVFALYDGADGPVLWSEIRSLTADRGAFTAALGTDPDNPLPDDAFWGDGEVWLGLQVESELPLPRQRLLSQPFALEARHAATGVAATLDCVGCVGVEALAVTPASQEDLEALDLRVAALETVLPTLGGATLGALPCGEGESPVRAGAGWSCVPALATDADVEGVRVTSVDGLAGGTITGDTAVTGGAAADELTQAGNIVCDASGNCGATLANLTCQTDQMLRRAGDGWECVDMPAPTRPETACSGYGQALQWDGAEWLCVELAETGLSAGDANGWELTDEHGFVWDAIDRGAATWEDAIATCEAAGGRLPTPTELWRNNATTGSGNLANVRQNPYLWTIITNYRDYVVVVRLSDGTISDSTKTNTRAFRCVWPDHSSAAFDGDHCHGPAGASCAPTGRLWNVDRYNRPAMDAVAASHECNFYNASIPRLADWSSMIHAGDVEDGENAWLWSAGVGYYNSSPYYLHPVLRFDEATAETWSYTSLQNDGMGGWNWPTTATAFRCIGLRTADEGVDPVTDCVGGCFHVAPSPSDSAAHRGRRAAIWADKLDRAPATRTEAMAICEAAGGTLPDIAEFQELVHAGWPGGTNEWLWTAEPIYRGHYTHALARWSGPGAPYWYVHHSSYVGWSSPELEDRAFRCVWHQTHEAGLPSCAADETPQWLEEDDGGAWSCVATAAPDDAGNAMDGGFADGWGNVWDAADRDPASRFDARALCDLMGARLPTATELWRLRAGRDGALPAATDAALWTDLPSYRQGHGLLMALDTGVASDDCTATDCDPHAYRCVWPVGDRTAFFGGANCSASADDGPCFAGTNSLWDATDRAPIPVAAAARECAAVGARLPHLWDLESALHQGLPNGNWNAWIQLQQAAYDGNFWQLSARWSGAGVQDWFFNGVATATAGARHYADVFDGFRCTVSDVLR